MANVSRINGFWPKYHLAGSHIQARRYFVPSTDGTAIYPGDPVKLAGSADTDGTTPTVALGTAGAAIVGICVGVAPDFDNLNTTNNYRLASTNRYILVIDDPQVVFEAETSNGTFAAVDVALNASFAIGTPSTTTATSGAYVDVGTKATTAALELKFLGFSSRVDNEVAASAKVLVKINNHQMAVGTGSAGV